MNPGLRKVVFLLGATGVAGLFAWGVAGLHPVGAYPGPYGDLADAVAVTERHITDAVTAVNFDLRGFDTLGEEFILFASVMGVRVLLRRLAGEHHGSVEGDASEEYAPYDSDAVRVFVVVLAVLIVLFGAYVVAHGHLTPGGGFQGGVILATVPLLIFLAGGFKSFLDVAPVRWADLAEAVGAGAYATIGMAGLIAAGAFLQNVLPYGRLGTVFSGGTIPLINLATGLEVAAGFTVLLAAFLEETYGLRSRSGS